MRALYLLTFLMVAGIANAQVDPPEGWEEDPWADDETDTLRWNGFIEGALGSRWQRDPQLAEKTSLGDLRLRLETERAGDVFTVGFKGDLWYDGFLGAFDGELRDLTLAFSPTSNWDVKIGRQVLTWGTGDLVFLNDLFPKDWVSFFAGRQDEYLKAPSNTIRATRYADAVNVDLAWTPIFEPDEFLTGERFSFFSPVAGRRVAPSPTLNPVEPNERFENGELALRLFKSIDAVEYAVYAYHGYFHQPTAFTEELQPTFAPLLAIGASLRRPLGGGLFNTELAYYASRDDRSGDDPLVPNDQVRLLLGYEREAVTNFTVAFQYYLEWTQDHDALVANSPTSQFEPDEYRHVLTNRLTYRTDQDKLTLSLFTFYSPSDRDYYLRPQLSYRYSDKWMLTGGANVFGGQDAHTFFEQFADNGNLYVRFRYNY